jgi:hypothetical protein
VTDRSAIAAVDVLPPSSGAVAAPAGRRGGARGRLRAHLSVLAIAVPAAVAVVRLGLAAYRPFDFFGDEAVLDSAVRHVGHQLVGPYSRFGFHEPGPAYFYLQAPFSRLPGSSAATLFFGAFCINAAAALGCVLVARRFLGEAAARWSAVVVGALLICLAPELADPWNPYVLALPVLFAIVLAVMWAPPVVDQLTHSPGNLRALARFFRASHAQDDRGVDHSLATTAGQVAAELTAVPFGHDRRARPTDDVKVLLAAAGVLGAAGVAAAGWRRRRATVCALGAMSVVGPLVAVWSGTRIVGEAFPYLLFWTTGLLVPGAIGAGALVVTRPEGAGRHRSGRLIGVGAAAVGLGLAVALVRQPLPPYGTNREVTAAARLAESWAAGRAVGAVRIHIAQHDRWPLATGVAVRLEKDGVKTTVDPDWVFLFGDHFRPSGHEAGAVWIADAGATPAGAGLNRLGAVGEASIWAGPSDPAPDLKRN